MHKYVRFAWYIFFKIVFILFLVKGEEREKEKERNIKWLPLTHPQLGPGLPHRHVHCPGIEPATFQFPSQCSIH